MPEKYARSLLGDVTGPYAPTPESDAAALATIRHYRSLVPMAQAVRKPVFNLTSADGAIGSHAVAANSAYGDFRSLAQNILERLPEPVARSVDPGARIGSQMRESIETP